MRLKIIPYEDSKGNLHDVKRTTRYWQDNPNFDPKIEISTDNPEGRYKKLKFAIFKMELEFHGTPISIRHAHKTWRIEWMPSEIRERGAFKPIKGFKPNIEIFSDNQNFMEHLAKRFGEDDAIMILLKFSEAYQSKRKKKGSRA